jgi:hypothetical protein
METPQRFISCIRRLSSEILGEIFVQCLPPHPYTQPDSKTVPVPVLPTRICKGWRKMALEHTSTVVFVPLDPRRTYPSFRNDRQELEASPLSCSRCLPLVGRQYSRRCWTLNSWSCCGSRLLLNINESPCSRLTLPIFRHRKISVSPRAGVSILR